MYGQLEANCGTSISSWSKKSNRLGAEVIVQMGKVCYDMATYILIDQLRYRQKLSAYTV